LLLEHSDGQHHVVNVVEDKRATIAVCLLALEEMNRSVSPVTARIEMMGSVIAVVETEAVAGNIDESDAASEV